MTSTNVAFANAARSRVITANDDDAAVRSAYRPYLLPRSCTDDWVADLELGAIESMVDEHLAADDGKRLKFLVLYGSLRTRSYSKLLAYECARILHRLGCDVRVYDPAGLPVKDDVQDQHAKVQELRSLSEWSDGHVWVSPEQHGNITAVFKNQIDWIPLSTGSVRPTQGRTLAIAQVSGGSQSFNTVNTLRVLGRWMRMFAIPNQSSVPKAYTQFTSDQPDDPSSCTCDRMLPSSNRDRVVDCMEELVKFTLIIRPHFELFADRYSERKDKKQQQEKSSVNGVKLNSI